MRPSVCLSVKSPHNTSGTKSFRGYFVDSTLIDVVVRVIQHRGGRGKIPNMRVYVYSVCVRVRERERDSERKSLSSKLMTLANLHNTDLLLLLASAHRAALNSWD